MTAVAAVAAPFMEVRTVNRSCLTSSSAIVPYVASACQLTTSFVARCNGYVALMQRQCDGRVCSACQLTTSSQYFLPKSTTGSCLFILPVCLSVMISKSSSHL